MRKQLAIAIVAIFASIAATTAQARTHWHDSRARVRALTPAFLCIHRFEGAWNDRGAPYYGGLQMDWQFMSAYGPEFLRRWGTADHWPSQVQILVAVRAHDSGRGFDPWPTTARRCGLI
jgi:hypothetical protein